MKKIAYHPSSACSNVWLWEPLLFILLQSRALPGQQETGFVGREEKEEKQCHRDATRHLMIDLPNFRVLKGVSSWGVGNTQQLWWEMGEGTCGMWKEEVILVHTDTWVNNGNLKQRAPSKEIKKKSQYCSKLGGYKKKRLEGMWHTNKWVSVLTHNATNSDINISCDCPNLPRNRQI